MCGSYIAPSQILIVNDDHVMQSSLLGGLENFGHRISVAETLSDAESLLIGGYRPDLVVMELSLAEDNGLAFAQRLRLIDRIPFLILSALDDASLVRQACEVGALCYLLKPVQTSQMVAAIEAALTRGHELRRLHKEHEQLRNALSQERDVGVAVGITMVERRLTRDAAFIFLRDTARSRRCKLASLASEVIQKMRHL